MNVLGEAPRRAENERFLKRIANIFKPIDLVDAFLPVCLFNCYSGYIIVLN